MRRVILTVVWLSLFLCVLSGATCQQVEIKDHEICGDKGELGAACFHTLTEQSRSLDFYEWEEQRFGWLCMPSDAFADLKATLLKLCESSHRCKYEDLEAITNRIESFKKELQTQ
jgi:hypothetical protein